MDSFSNVMIVYNAKEKLIIISNISWTITAYKFECHKTYKLYIHAWLPTEIFIVGETIPPPNKEAPPYRQNRSPA